MTRDSGEMTTGRHRTSEKSGSTGNLDHGLSPRQLATVRRILEPWANRITAVEVFGSRATGAYRPNSDLDLLLHGDLDQRAINRLWTLFHESSLPFAVDVKSYGLITHEPLREHMDRVRRPLFDSLTD
ncbi:MAG: nucleotidyltransferase domain-containing protein [Acidobacteriota bacterium]|nr:nucleotidyltransferase domain-containing protein [Acidobacteriota bacterium]